MAAAAARGLAPQDDRDLLPVLLELLGEYVPVEQWPGRRAKEAAGKRRRATLAREEQRGQAAAQDRHRPRQLAKSASEAEVVSLRRDQVRSAVDTDRAWRRQTAVPSTPQPPGLLGSEYRERDPFLLPPDDNDEESDE